MTTDTVRLSQPLRIWERIEILVGDGAQAGRYLSRIQDFLNDGIVIAEPELVGGNSLLRDNCAVNVTVVRDDAIYQFSSVIRRLGHRDQTPLVLAPPNRFRRIQRRSFVRIELIRRVHFAALASPPDWSIYPAGVRWETFHTVDISGGGIQCQTADPQPVGSSLLIRAPFLADTAVPEFLFGLVRRQSSRDGVRTIGVEFLRNDQIRQTLGETYFSQMPTDFRQFDHNAQNRLVTWVFNQQLELRKKGLL